MIFQRSVFRELTHSASVVFVTLLTIVLTISLVRLLGSAANNDIARESVVALMSFSAINNLPVILQLTVFIAVLMVLTRMGRAGEMVVWLSSGVGWLTWVKQILRFAFPLALLVALLSLVVTPWAHRQASEFKTRFAQRNDVSRAAPGQFRESADGSRVFFVEGILDGQPVVRNVFVSTFQNGQMGVVVSPIGYTQRQANGDEFLILEKGRRYQGTPGLADYRVMEFERYGMRISSSANKADAESSTSMQSTLELINQATPASLGELVWRIGLPFSVMSLALLAIPLSLVNPRAGRSANLMIALLIYFIYSNSLSLLQSWTSQGKLAFSLAWWSLHVAVIALTIALLWQRTYPRRWFPVLKVIGRRS